MIPRNAELFSDLSPTEKLLILSDDFPWQAITRMEALFEQYRCGEKPWPEEMPLYTRINRNAGHVLDIIGTFDTGHVRGGWNVGTDENVVLRGPVYLGRNVKLRKGAVITGPCFIGDNVTIGQVCRIKHAIIRSGTEIQYGTRVAHCVIGKDVFVGTNIVFNDRTLDDKEIQIEERMNIKPTGQKQLGVMVGDGCRMGGGSVFVPGVILRPNTMVEAACAILHTGVYDGRLSLTR